MLQSHQYVQSEPEPRIILSLFPWLQVVCCMHDDEEEGDEYCNCAK